VTSDPDNQQHGFTSLFVCMYRIVFFELFFFTLQKMTANGHDKQTSKTDNKTKNRKHKSTARELQTSYSQPFSSREYLLRLTAHTRYMSVGEVRV
jgi:hypothetical protein